jgi:hypothetical protein
VKIEDIVLRDGRKVLDACPNAGNYLGKDATFVFASLPAGRKGYAFIEAGDGDDRYVWIYDFHPTGETDFVEGLFVRPRQA